MRAAFAPPVDMIANERPAGIGVVGLGRAGAHYLEQLSLREDCRALAAFDTAGQARRNVAGLAAALPDRLDAVLENDAIDAVFVATPPEVLAEVGLQVLAAGKHAVVEAPLALVASDLERLAQASDRYGRSVIAAHIWRSDEDFQMACGVVDSGRLGKTLSLQLTSWQYNPWRSGGPFSGAPERGGPFMGSHWRGAARAGGGVLWQFGPRYFDQLLLLAGQEPESVFAALFDSPEVPGLDEGFLAVVRFCGGLLAQLDVRRASPAPCETGWVIQGEHAVFCRAVEYQAAPDGEVVDVPAEPPPQPAKGFLDAVLAHVRGAAPNPCPIGEAAKAWALLQAVRASAERGQAVNVVTPGMNLEWQLKPGSW
jgi:predicted dehydrogenase